MSDETIDMRPSTRARSDAARPVEEVPVLIVGAGPAGLTTAITLGRAGIESLIVDQREHRAGHPRATAVSTRSMELMRSWGLEDEVRAGAIAVDWIGWMSATLASGAQGTAMPVGYPTRAQSEMVSPTAPACAPQDHLEPVLLGYLLSLGRARIELGTELLAVAPGPDGVEAIVRDGATGRSRVVRSRYVVGADGAHSAVRAALRIAVHGPGHLADGVTALFRAPLWKLLGDRRHVIYSVTEPVPGAFIPAGRGDRWIYGTRWEPGEDEAANYTLERMTDLIRRAAGDSGLRPQIERIGPVAYAAHLAERFRDGNVFLVGDAAHRVTPRGGTGMNTAIHSAHDLGWKLAWVLHGWAPQELLDSYEAERRPVAEHNVIRSADPNGSVREAAQELHADLGGRIAHVWLPSGDGRVSTLDLLGPGVTVFTGPDREAWKRAAAHAPGLPPVAVRSLDAVTARALGIRASGALLSRPDGAPVALWSSAEQLVDRALARRLVVAPADDLGAVADAAA
jgi:2-polyprenyl-6-methoxyphenol hydroxylase-like FAD-dependent oxidoreductase